MPNLHASSADASDGDPDIDTLPILAWSLKMAEQAKDSPSAQFLIKWQAVFYFPVLLEERRKKIRILSLLCSKYIMGVDSQTLSVCTTRIVVFYLCRSTTSFIGPALSPHGDLYTAGRVEELIFFGRRI